MSSQIRLAPFALSRRRGSLPLGHLAPRFDPDVGAGARVLFQLENPGRRATSTRGSGFISAECPVQRDAERRVAGRLKAQIRLVMTNR